MTPHLPDALYPSAQAYLGLLERWNQTHALTALPQEIRFEELILDACALLPHLEDLPAGSTVADFGTGMGIPAVVIAFARPDLKVVGVDKAGKKMAFLRQVILELGLSNLEVRLGRAESLSPIQAHAGTAKATGPLPLLAAWWDRHGQPNAPFFAFKGPGWDQEPRPEGFHLDTAPYHLPTRGERLILRMERPRT